jgi:hypothetical protein
MTVCIQLLTLEHCCRISTRFCLNSFLTTLIASQATTTCLPTWKTEWDHSASTIMRSWWTVSKRGWAHKKQTSLTKAYRIISPNKGSVSVPVVTMIRSSLSMYIFFAYNKLVFLIACSVSSPLDVTFQIALTFYIRPWLLPYTSFWIQYHWIIWCYTF